MKAIGLIVDASKDYKTKKTKLTLALNIEVPADELDELIDIPLDVTIKKHHPKRSLDANAYCWVLLGKLSAKLQMPADELYREAIRDVGDNYDIVCVQNKALEGLEHAWQAHGLGWLTERFDSKVEGCTNVRLFYGSSIYTTAQMSRLINIVVEECKANGISTATPEDLARIVEQW